MANIFLASDHHFGHANILTFKKDNGDPLRVFDHVDHMNEYIIERHNSVVSPQDKVYYCGDVTMSNKYMYLLSRMNGEKILIKGNHDVLKLSQYEPYFKDVRGTHQLSGVILSHIPIHPESLSRWKLNVHGHLHSYRVKDQYGKPDPRYYNVSMECLKDYTPVSLEQIKAERGIA